MGRTTAEQRKRVAARDGWRCRWCLRIIREAPCPEEERATLEHLLPKSQGGTWALSNLALACAPCNERRRDPDAPDVAPEFLPLKSTPPPRR
jgi:5-methylcytosine-specific restriction endonuclease McrA